MSSASIGPEFPRVKLPKATHLTWEEGYLTPCPLLCLELCPSALLLPSDPAVLFIELIQQINPAENLPWCGGIQPLWLVCEDKANQGHWQEENFWGINKQRMWLGGTQLHGRDGAQHKWLKSQAQSQDLWQHCDICSSWMISLWAFGGDVQGVCCGKMLPWVQGVCTTFLCDAENISIRGGKGVFQ